MVMNFSFHIPVSHVFNFWWSLISFNTLHTGFKYHMLPSMEVLHMHLQKQKLNLYSQCTSLHETGNMHKGI